MFFNIASALGTLADTATANCLEGRSAAQLCDTGLPKIAASSGQLQIVLQILFGILAVIAVLIVTIAGLRFIFESSNPQETARARNTIIYAAIGLIIALSGEAIVSFILGRL